MKKIIVAVVLALCVSTLVGCTSATATPTVKPTTKM